MDYKTTFELPADDAWPGDEHTEPYLFSEDIAVALDVAMVTKRPLLVAGPPGSGKSTLASAMAAVKKWSYLYYTFTSRSRLEDLTGGTDQLRRLNDANANQLLPDWAYREPGILWWLFRPNTAATRGAKKTDIAQLDDRFLKPERPRGHKREKPNTVLLLDEIDKAEPDLPNDLLEPLDRRRFTVPNGPEVEATDDLDMLVIITTNGERELPPAFLRRCISLVLEDPDEDRLQAIACKHFPEGDGDLHLAVALKVLEQRERSRQLDLRPPGTSEYLDAVQACAKLGITPRHKVWRQVEKATLIKDESSHV